MPFTCVQLPVFEMRSSGVPIANLQMIFPFGSTLKFVGVGEIVFRLRQSTSGGGEGKGVGCDG